MYAKHNAKFMAILHKHGHGMSRVMPCYAGDSVLAEYSSTNRRLQTFKLPLKAALAPS